MKYRKLVTLALTFLVLILTDQMIFADDSVKKSDHGNHQAKIVAGEQSHLRANPLEEDALNESSRSGEVKWSTDDPVPGACETRDIPYEDFESNYREFLERQETPLTSADEELFLLDGQIWKRVYGEREYFLVPRIVDLPEYENRITRLDDKERGIQKSRFHVVNVEVTRQSVSLLSQMGIDIPDYVEDSFNTQLPQIDIDTLLKHNIKMNVLDSYGHESFENSTISETESSRVTIWSDDFEGSFPDTIYGVSDENPESGEDYWDDLSCECHGGGWSIWCADMGDQPHCVNYDNDMDAWFWILRSIDISAYTNVEFTFWVKYDTEVDYDYLRRYCWNNDAWQLVGEYTGDSGGWTQETVSLFGFTTYAFWFRFLADGSNSSFEGAYLDDMEISGDLNQPDLTYQSGTSTLNITDTQIDLTLSVINLGIADAGSSELGYYLSDDIEITTSDCMIGTNVVPDLGPGSFSEEYISVDVWSLCSPGVYFVGFLIDQLDEVEELDETNNDWYFGSEVIIPSEPNLTIMPDSGSLYVDGTQVDISIAVFNNGNDDVGSFEVGYYLSEDTLINPAVDCLIGADNVAGLESFNHIFEDISVDVGGLCSEGTYYAGYYVDHVNQIEETREDDNSGYFESPLVIIDSSNLPGDSTVSGSFPRSFGISQNYPNPFNPATTINYDIPMIEGEPAVSLKVYNLRGGLVATLVEERRTPGRYTVHWNGRDDRGIEVPSGVYLYKFQAGDFLETKRMVLVK